jgi:hypothetical protein
MLRNNFIIVWVIDLLTVTPHTIEKHNTGMAAQLPTQMLREYEYIRPICLASNKSRKTLPVKVTKDPDSGFRDLPPGLAVS